MASQMAAIGAQARRSEEGDALYRVVIAITAASGGMIATFAVAQGDVPLTAAPTLVLLIALLRRTPDVAAWSGVVLWALVLPMAHGIGILAPAAMTVICLAFAIGPERLLDWVRDEWIGREDDAVTLPMGWIEDGESGGRLT